MGLLGVIVDTGHDLQFQLVIQNAAGTMSCEEIYPWTCLCVMATDTIRIDG
jgi:hypothetical protein